MSTEKKLINAINTIILEMGDTFESHDNILNFIIDTLENKGFSNSIDDIGNEKTIEMIIYELKLVCNDLEYQSALESVIAIGLKEFFVTPKTTIAEAARLYATHFNHTGNFDEIINNVVTSMVEPILRKSKQLTIREAIILLGIDPIKKQLVS
ncbi:MAG: hypothetical protein ACC657_04170 [Thiohalomonadales bacterium]